MEKLVEKMLSEQENSILLFLISGRNNEVSSWSMEIQAASAYKFE